jgi:NitT/TauT family transport system permease protein
MSVVADSASRRRRKLPKASSLQHLIAPTILALLIMGWETYSRARNTPNYVLPRPSRIATDGWEQRSELWRQLGHTLLEAAAGFTLAAVVGIAIALLLQRSRAIEFAILPWLIVFQAVPIVALTPILAVIIGRNSSTVVLVAAIVSFFAIIINTLRGLRSVPDESLELFHVMAASPWETFRYLRLPGALPYVFTGFRVAASVVIPAAMVAEWIASDQGLGFYVVQQTALYRTELVWAGIVVATIAGIAVFAAVGLLERLIIPWHVEEPVQ